MTKRDKTKISGVYVAAVTPVTADLHPELDAIPDLLAFYARRGCHGALILGTTGEGPSFSHAERLSILKAGTAIWETFPDFKLLAGTGMVSLDATIQMNKAAFDLGYQGVVVLPPYYFRGASEDGIYTWFSEVIQHSIPAEGRLLGYHIPQVSGVPIPGSVLTRLAIAYPDQFGGIKDSSGDLAHAQAASASIPEHAVMVGNDRLMTASLESGAAGSITAAANLASPWLRQVYDAHQAGETGEHAQEVATATRAVLEQFSPFPAAIKGLLAEMFGFPLWPVLPPLEAFPHEKIRQAAGALEKILVTDEQP